MSPDTPSKTGAAKTMVPAVAEALQPGSSWRRFGVIEIERRSGRRVRVDREVDADALRRVRIPENSSGAVPILRRASA